MHARRTLTVQESDGAFRAWQRSNTLEDERDQASYLRVPLRMFISVTFLGTLLQMEYGGLALKAALASASGAGLLFAVVWLALTWWYGGDLPQILLRSALIVSLLGLWIVNYVMTSPGWRGTW